ncbi:MAG: phage tail sheath C-terminal domain-containing protein [bacterium]
MSNIGVNINERDAADAGRIVPSDIFGVGVVSASRRGPVALAVPLYNVNDDKKVFGDYGTNWLGGFMRRGLFVNCQEYGASVVTVRVIGDGAVAATKTFKDGAGTPADAWVFTAGYLGYESPGVDGNSIYIEIKDTPSDAAKRDVYVWYQGPKDSAQVLKEIHEALNNSNVVDVINRKSFYVKVALAEGATLTAKAITKTALTAGVDGSAPDASDYTAAYAKLNGKSVPVIFNADLHTAAGAAALKSYVEGRKSIGLCSSPLATSIATLTTDYAAMLQAKSFVCGYRGWGKVDNENGGLISIPLLGHVTGAAWIRKAMDRGGFPWVAPAGPATALRDVVELEYPGYSDAEVNELVQTVGFNPVQHVPGYGFVVRTSRTFSSQRKHYSAHVRRMTNFFIDSFQRSFMWIEQEPNNDDTRRRVTDGLTFFAQDCYRNGAFNTRGGITNNVKIKCDDENNSQDMVDRGELAADFSFHPVEAIESATVNIIQTRDNLVVSDK